MRHPVFSIYNRSYDYFWCWGAKEQSGLELILEELEESQNNLQLILNQLEQSEKSDKKLKEELIELKQLFETLSEQIPKQTGPEIPEGNEVNKAKFVNQRIKYYTEYGSSSNNKTVRNIDLPVEAQPVKEQPAEAQPVEAQPVEAQPVKEQPVEAQPVKEKYLTKKDFAVKAHNIFAEANIKEHNFEKNEKGGYKYEIEITGKHEVRIVDKKTGDLYTATFEKSDGSYKMTCSVDRIIKKEPEKEPGGLWEDMKKCMETEGHTLNVKCKGNDIESDKKELGDIEKELKECEFIKNWQKMLVGGLGGAVGGAVGGAMGGAVGNLLGQGVALGISHFFLGVAFGFSVPAIVAAAVPAIAATVAACAIGGFIGGLYYGLHSKKDDFCGVLWEVFKQSSLNSFPSSAIMGFAHPIMALSNVLGKLLESGVAGGSSRMFALFINNWLNGSTNERADYLKIGVKSACLGALFGGVDLLVDRWLDSLNLDLAVDRWLDSRHLDWLDPYHLGWLDPTANVVVNFVANVALNCIPNYRLNNTNDKYQFLLPLLTGLATVVVQHNDVIDAAAKQIDDASKVNEFDVVAKQIADAQKVDPIPPIIPVDSHNNHITPTTGLQKNDDASKVDPIPPIIPVDSHNNHITPTTEPKTHEVKTTIIKTTSETTNGTTSEEIKITSPADINPIDTENNGSYKGGELYIDAKNEDFTRYIVVDKEGFVTENIVVDKDGELILFYETHPINPEAIVKSEKGGSVWEVRYYYKDPQGENPNGEGHTIGDSRQNTPGDDSNKEDGKVAKAMAAYGFHTPQSEGKPVLYRWNEYDKIPPMFGRKGDVGAELEGFVRVKITTGVTTTVVKVPDSDSPSSIIGNALITSKNQHSR